MNKNDYIELINNIDYLIEDFKRKNWQHVNTTPEKYDFWREYNADVCDVIVDHLERLKYLENDSE